MILLLLQGINSLLNQTTERKTCYFPPSFRDAENENHQKHESLCFEKFITFSKDLKILIAKFNSFIKLLVIISNSFNNQ